MSWLVTGGAGYIGAHVVHALCSRGEPVVVLDDLSTGDAARVPSDVPLVQATVLDAAALERALRDHQVQGVIHIAAKKQVGESMAEPLRYYRENVEGLRTLLAAVQAAGVERVVFSSSAATYGLPSGTGLLREQDAVRPISPYGETKLVGEWLLAGQGQATGLRTCALRYFNVAGAVTPELGDPGVFNLIPLVFQAMYGGRQPTVFGADYDTPDGTCIRDYIHVADIADAHAAALLRLDDPGFTGVYNVGRGQGSSVLEVIREVAAVTGVELAPVVAPRRAGDPPRSVAAVDRVTADLGWRASHDLAAMVSSAWAGWQLRHGPLPPR